MFYIVLFSYKIDLFGRGYSSEKALEGHPNKPDVEIRASVTGPDPGYNATSGIFTTLAMVSSIWAASFSVIVCVRFYSLRRTRWQRRKEECTPRLWCLGAVLLQEGSQRRGMLLLVPILFSEYY